MNKRDALHIIRSVANSLRQNPKKLDRVTLHELANLLESSADKLSIKIEMLEDTYDV